MIFNPTPVKVLLLSIITCGIYYIYWIVKFNSALNQLEPENPNSTGLLILSILCFPLGIYLYYLWGKKLYSIEQKDETLRNRATDNSTLLAVFGFLLPFVSLFIAQDQLNAIYNAKGLMTSN